MEINSFHIEGMTCAACTAAVERSVSRLDGVLAVHVNLLTKSMKVEIDSAIVDHSLIEEAVAKAGYAAQLQLDNQKDIQHTTDLALLKTRFVVSLILLFPLLYLSMGEMLGLPQPASFSTSSGALFSWIFQGFLAFPILVLNRVFFTKGFRALFRGTPTMDSLIAVGSTAALGYGVWTFISLTEAVRADNVHLVHALMHRSYIESAATILTLVTLGKYLEARSLDKTSGALKTLLKLVPQTACVKRSGQELILPVEQVQTGDEVILKPGFTAPVDGIVISGFSSMEESMLTGESIPVEKFAGERILSGAGNLNGYLIYQATRTGEDSTLSRLINMVREAAATKAPIARLADTISGFFVPVVLVLSLITFCGWLLAGGTLEFALNTAVAVLVISCPCALGLATPVALVVGTGKGAAAGLLFRSGEAMEMTGRVTTVVFDKTGTLTTGKPVLADILLNENTTEERLIQLAGSLENCSEHPLAESVLNYVRSRNTVLLAVENFSAYPGKGIAGQIENEWYYAGNEALMAQFSIPLNDSHRKISELAAFGKTPLLIASSSRLLGCLAVSDELKDDARQAIDELNAMNIRTVLLSGDRKEAVQYIAAKLGIKETIAEVLPDQKANVVEQLCREGQVVMMVGDGMNDAPALGRADVGVALGNGSDLSVQTADVILTRNSPSDVPESIRLSKAVVRTIRQNLFWAFLYNVAGIPLAAGLFYPLTGWTLSPMFAAAAMSLSSVSVVTNALRLRSYRQKARVVQTHETTIISETITSHFMKTNVLTIGGMSCGHCSSRVEKALNALEGVQAKVDLQTGKATVEQTGSVTDAVLKKVVEEAGYDVLSVE